MRRRHALLLAFVLALAAGFGLLAWLGPGDGLRGLAGALASRALGAPVEIAEVELSGWLSVVARGVEVETSARLPYVENARFARVTLEGNPWALLRGDVARLAVEDGSIRLQPPAPWTLPPSALPRIARLELTGVAVEVAGATPLNVAASLAGFGSAGTSGSATISGDAVELLPWLRFAGIEVQAEGAAGQSGRSTITATFDADGGMAVEGTLAALELASGQGRARLPTLDFAARRRPDGALAASIAAPEATLLAAGRELALVALAVRANLGAESGELHLGAGRAVWRENGRSRELAAPELALALAATPEVGVFELAGHCTLELLESCTVAGRFDRKGRTFSDLAASLGGVEIAAVLPWLPLPAELSGQGRLDLALAPAGAAGARLLVSGADLEIALRRQDAVLELSRLDARLAAEIAPGSWTRWTTATLELTSPATGALRLSGDVDLGAAAGPTLAGGRWSWKRARLEELAALARAAGAPWPVGLELAGELEAAGEVAGEVLAPTLRGGVELRRLTAQANAPLAWQLTQGRAKATFELRGERLRARGLDAAGQLTLAQLAPVAFTAAVGNLGFDLATGAAELADLRLANSELGALAAEGTWSPARGADARLRAEELELPAWRAFLRPLTGELGPGLTVAGTARAELSASWESTAGFRVEGPLSLAEGGFATDDGSKVLAGLTSGWRLLASGDGHGLTLTATGSAAGAQLLWGSFYADFSALAPELNAQAEIAWGANGAPGAWSAAFVAELGAQARLETNARAAPGSPLGFELALAVPDLAALYEASLRRPLTDASERFATLRLGGALAAECRGTRAADGRIELVGRLTTDDLELGSGGGQLTLRALDLELPLRLAVTPEGGLEDGAAATGRLAFAGIELAGLRLPAAASALAVAGDSVTFVEPLAVPMAGGTVALEGLALVDLGQPERHLRTGVRLAGLELAQLASALGGLPLQGRLDGHFPAVRLDASTLEVEGGGEVAAFGGTVRVGEISGREILSRYPRLTFSAELVEIDLGQLTRHFDVGEMNGVLSGQIRQCTLFRATPVRCSARFETVERKGVPRTISVKAVKNITILGTGQDVGFLDRGIHRFFDKYTYSRLGIELELDNDVFLLRGLEHRGDRELFLSGRLPFPIVVVNAQPGRAVSFQTMLRRLRSIDLASATTS